MRLGVIGYGSRIHDVIERNIRNLVPEARVTGIVDPDETDVRARLAECDRGEAVFYPTLDDLVRKGKPDALLIGTRCNLHTPYAIEAARYDLPLFLEKPVATTIEQTLALEAAFENSRCPVVVSFPLRVSPLCEMARKKLEGGAIGRPEHILAVNYVPYGTLYFDCAYRQFAINQGQFLQKATHDFDAMMFLMDAPIVRVAAMAQWGRVFGGDKPAGLTCSRCGEARTCLESPENRKRNRSGGAEWDHACVFGEDLGTPESGMNEDASSALVEFAGGAQGVYTQVFYTRREAGRRGARISGYHGTLEFDWQSNKIDIVYHHRPFKETVAAGAGMSHFGGDEALTRNFIEVIRHGAASRTPIESGLSSVYACLAAKRSAESGQFMEVRQPGALGHTS